MNRRDSLKMTACLGLTSAWPLSLAFSQPVPSWSHSTPGWQRFRLGELELLILTDGKLVGPSVQPVFAPGVAAAAVEQVLTEHFLPTDHVDFALNVLLINAGKRLILIDTGNGSLGGPASGHLLANLRAAGLAPSAITDIVLTHAHSDHVGGLLTPRGKLAFPRARIHLGRVEYAFWTSPQPDFSASKSQDPQLPAFQLQTLARVLPAVRDRLQLYEDGETLFDCLRLQLAPGHTPGHTILTVFSGTEQLVHLVDTVHHHALLLAHPEWGTEYDIDFERAILTRRQVLGDLAQRRQLTFAYHLPWPGLGYVRRRGAGFEWVAQAVATPT